MDDCGAFQTNELWRPSIFTLDSDPNKSIFGDLNLDAVSALAPKETESNLFDGLVDELDLPPLEDLPPAVELDDESLEDLHAKPPPGGQQDEPRDGHDVWDFDSEPAPISSGPQLHTWEAFQLKDDRPIHPAYLSEAGNGAFDALFQQREKSAGVIRHDYTLRSCCSLILGRSSTLFQWDPVKRSFAPTVDQVSVSGLSLLGSQNVMQHFMQAGTVFRELSMFAADSKAQDCTAMVAFRRSISGVLDHLEQHICGHITHVRSILHLQQAIERPTSILKHFRTLTGNLRQVRTDEDLISMLSDEVTSLAESGSVLAGILQEVLVHVSAPWLQRLAEDVGLSAGLQTGEAWPAFDGTASAPPNTTPKAKFLAVEDHRDISSVKHSIRLLRQHAPSHPLVNSSASIFSGGPLQTVSTSVHGTLPQRADEYRAQMLEALTKYQRGDLSTPLLMRSLATKGNTVSAEQTDPFAIPALEDVTIMDTDISTASPSDGDVYHGLREALALVVGTNTDDVFHDVAAGAQDILSPIRPFIEVQASLVNTAVLGYLFNTYGLREHLELHRSYHLFGNSEFITRLTTALFSDEAQSAERKRGNIPTSETMGLRLGSKGDQRWPPASSELRLTLLNVLSDSYGSHDTEQDPPQLPGGLSFAIRELSDEEIDRVMDPTSIYALDFLRLQYTPPSPLADIFTSTIIQHYDSIFRTLLVHVRVLHATAQLAMLCNKSHTKQMDNDTTALRRFAWKARHFSTTLFSHFTDTVIAPAWNRFSSHLEDLQPTQDTASAARQQTHSAGLAHITRLHELCLDDIRSKLFLRRKHETLRTAVEGLEGIVVKTTAMLMHERVSISVQEHCFDELSGELWSLLENVASKPSKAERVAATDLLSESDSARLLLARLRWGKGNAATG